MATLTTLASLLPPSGLLLSYSLPLLFTSLVLTFGGTFLTLDRTRQFPRAYDAVAATPGHFGEAPKRRAKDLYMLGGGVGGLLSGWCFGMHFTSLLAVMIPAVTTNGPLNSKAFLAIWLISSVITMALGGRWRYSAITISGLTGGFMFSILLCVLLHPSLPTRLVMTAVFTSFILLLCLLPFPMVQYSALRLANASTGAVGLIISIALLANEPSWANVWERYWVADGYTWGTGKEKGLSAAAFILLVLGSAVDFLLKRKVGECPDQRWDSYLTKFSTNLPDRAGQFTPAQGFMSKLFNSSDRDEKDSMLFPEDDADHKMKQGFHGMGAPPAYDIQDLERNAVPRAHPGFLKKSRSQASQGRLSTKSGRKRAPVKFRPLDGGDLSSDDEEPLNPPFPRRPGFNSAVSDAATLVNESIDHEKDIAALKKKKKHGFGDKEVLDYSDGEDISELSTGTQTPRKTSGGSSSHPDSSWSPKFLQAQQRSSSSPRNSSTGFKAVPATPSLIRAIDRVQAAQREAYGGPSQGPPDGLPGLQEEEEDVVEEVFTVPATVKAPGVSVEDPKPHGGWTSFWRDVEKKNRASRDAVSPLPSADPFVSATATATAATNNPHAHS